MPSGDPRAARQVHDGSSRFPLERVPDAGLAAVPLLEPGLPGRGRTVARVFAHLHEVRAHQLPRDLARDLPVFEKDAQPERAALLAALAASGEAVATRLARPGGTRPAALLAAYLISHEPTGRPSLPGERRVFAFALRPPGGVGTRTARRRGCAALNLVVQRDSHHRGQFLLALKQNGVPVPDEARKGPVDSLVPEGRPEPLRRPRAGSPRNARPGAPTSRSRGVSREQRGPECGSRWG
ncbi:MAG TPA: hypothetical protein VHN99_02725 [Deinococcales bacterium]|nr:hypothetical protein [Deinococcales bacterium]